MNCTLFLWESISPTIVGLLAGDVVGNGKRSATFGATTSQNLAAIFGSHSLAEAMLVDSATVGGLKSSFHFMIILIFIHSYHYVNAHSAFGVQN